MAIINPPGFLQNAGATHTAEQVRDWHALLVAGKTGSTSLVARGGVHPSLGNALSVTQTGSPSMAVIVKSGLAAVPGSEGTKQGIYSCLNDADVTLSIAAASATLNRIDIVCVKVEDQAYSGSVNAASLVVVTGTPAASPSAPTAPNNSIVLAQVSIVANDTSITNSEITDKRFYLAATGGIIICSSTTRPAAGTVSAGQVAYETDSTSLIVTDNDGTTWRKIGPKGCIARVQRTTTYSSTGAEVGVLRLDNVPVISGNLYLIQVHGMNFTGGASNLAVAGRIRVNSAGTATTGSTQIADTGDEVSTSFAPYQGTPLAGIYVPGANQTLSALFSVAIVGGTGTANFTGSATNPVNFMITDLGTDPGTGLGVIL
jgi:hypothetical protein